MTFQKINNSLEIQDKVTKEQKYHSFLQALCRCKGFGLLFVECSPSQATWLINNSKQDLASKKIVVWELEQEVNTLYDLVSQAVKKQNIDILFIQGLEHSLDKYEAQRKREDWQSEDIDTYIWRDVPTILSYLNQQRERFRDDFKICFVFLLSRFAIDYFIKRAPDCFDWRSNLFCFPLEKDLLQQESLKLSFGHVSDYRSLTSQQRRKKLVVIQALLDEEEQTPAQKVNLLFEQGLLYQIDNCHELALASYERALELNRDHDSAWHNRGNALYNLGRFEEALASYERALKLNSDNDITWHNQGNALRKLGRFEEAIASYERALKLNSDNDIAWHNRGLALHNLGRFAEAIVSYELALKLNRDDDIAWYNRARAYALNGEIEPALANLEKAIKINPKNLEMAKTDSDFDLIREYRRFLQMAEK